MTDFTPRTAAACALTLLVMAADTTTTSHVPSPSRPSRGIEQVGAYASALGPRQTAVHVVPLEQGRESHVVATCGDGCDVDLALLSPVGREIDRHVSSGTPEVAVIPAASGRYQAVVTMRRCDATVCAYTLAVMAR
jgi:hypothetical protein